MAQWGGGQAERSRSEKTPTSEAERSQMGSPRTNAGADSHQGLAAVAQCAGDCRGWAPEARAEMGSAHGHQSTRPPRETAAVAAQCAGQSQTLAVYRGPAGPSIPTRGWVLGAWRWGGSGASRRRGQGGGGTAGGSKKILAACRRRRGRRAPNT